MEDAGGEVHQLIGDAVMVVFDKQGDQPDHALLAAPGRARVPGSRRGRRPLVTGVARFRVGVNTGEVVAGCSAITATASTMSSATR